MRPVIFRASSSVLAAAISGAKAWTMFFTPGEAVAPRSNARFLGGGVDHGPHQVVGHQTEMDFLFHHLRCGAGLR
jgi:hypothetical protein